MHRLQFEDSEVASVRWHGSAIVLRFSAAQLADAGYLRGVELHIEQARVDEPAELRNLIGRLRDGQLRLDDGKLLKSVPVPFRHAHSIELALGFANGETLRLRGSAAVLSANPGAMPVDDYRC